jgi:hypothetical protein
MSFNPFDWIPGGLPFVLVCMAIAFVLLLITDRR